MYANGNLVAVTIIFSYSCILQSTMDQRSSDTSQGPLTEMHDMPATSRQQENEETKESDSKTSTPSTKSAESSQQKIQGNIT